jgi:hypothetical protein
MSSPPYISGGHHPDQTGSWGGKATKRGLGTKEAAGYGHTKGQLGQMHEGKLDAVVSSPPYNGNVKSDYLLSEDKRTRARDVKRGFPQGRGCFRGSEMYGDTPGQLGRMKENPIDAVIPSPPFMEQQKGGGLAKPNAVYAKDGHPFGCNHGYQNQGETAGNLASLPAGEIEAVISSPPYEGVSLRPGESSLPEQKIERLKKEGNFKAAETIRQHNSGKASNLRQTGYGDTPGQVEMLTGDTFWSAAQLIVEQAFLLLKPGGHALWVVKPFVRNKQLVDFPGQWRHLCETCGFTTVHAPCYANRTIRWATLSQR